jgi:hypothetical protein
MAADLAQDGDRSVAAKSLMFFAAFGSDASQVRERAEAVFDDLLVPVSQGLGLTVVKVDRDSMPGDIVDQTFKQLLECRLAICDVSGSSPNVFYELGVIHSCNIPVVLLCEDSTELPFYIQHERAIVVPNGKDLQKEEVRDELVSAVEVVLSDAYTPSSAISSALGTGTYFPAPLREALRRSAVPLYRESMEYDLHVTAVSDASIAMRLGVSYQLVNQLRIDFNQTVGIVPMRPFTPIYGEIDGKQLDVRHPDFLTARGWQIPYEFPARSKTRVKLVADVTYRLPDADVFATYLPATDFRLKLRFPDDSIDVFAEPLMRARISPDEIAKGVREYNPSGALLAYEGFRIDWVARSARAV